MLWSAVKSASGWTISPCRGANNVQEILALKYCVDWRYFYSLSQYQNGVSILGQVIALFQVILLPNSSDAVPSCVRIWPLNRQIWRFNPPPLLEWTTIDLGWLEGPVLYVIPRGKNFPIMYALPSRHYSEGGADYNVWSVVKVPLRYMYH